MQIPADAATKSPFLSIFTDASAKKTTQSNVFPQLRQAKAHFLCRDGTHVDVQGAFSAIAANRRAEGRKGRRAEGQKGGRKHSLPPNDLQQDRQHVFQERTSL
jgi:hypothetical protein